MMVALTFKLGIGIFVPMPESKEGDSGRKITGHFLMFKICVLNHNCSRTSLEFLIFFGHLRMRAMMF
jgi:hypothetical protein